MVHGVRRAEPLLAVGAELVVGPRWPEVELAGTAAVGEDAEPVVVTDALDREPLAPGRNGSEAAVALEAVAPVGSRTWRP